MNRFVILIAVFVSGLVTTCRAEDSEIAMIQWNELAPDGELFRDPLAKLSPNQLRDLGFIVRVRRLIIEKKVSANGADAAEAASIGRTLEQQGVEINYLLAQRDRIRDLREHLIREHAASVAKKLTGRRIRLTGFVVPLKESQRGVTEFYLVPLASLCSHGAFPPSNQIVHVQSREGVAIEDRTTVVQVTGTLQQRTNKQTFFHPGSSTHVEAVYAITPTAIEVVESRDGDVNGKES